MERLEKGATNDGIDDVGFFEGVFAKIENVFLARPIPIDILVRIGDNAQAGASVRLNQRREGGRSRKERFAREVDLGGDPEQLQHGGRNI